MNFLVDIAKQFRAIWARLDGGQRLIVVTVMLGAITGLGAMVWYAGRPSYEEVFTAQNADDLKEAKRLLTQAGIAFVPDDSGHALRVERSKVGLAHSAIYEGGLQGGGTDALKPGLGMIEDSDTRAFRLDNASRAQAVAAIQALDGVLSAMVTASRPRRSPFRDRDAETRPVATVALRLKAGARFEAVARSAASLASAQLMVPMENVTVYDATTHQRWKHNPDQEAGGTGASEFLRQQRDIAMERARAAQEALDQLWPGKTVVSVNVDLDTAYEITSQKVMPAEPILRSEKHTKDSTENQTVGGAAGPSPDQSAVALGNETPAAASGNRNNTKKEQHDREFVTDIGEKKVGRLAPEVRRLSVALVYDKRLEQKDGFVKDDLVKLVKSIVGWDAKRDADEAFSMLAGEFPEEPAVTASVGPGLTDQALKWGPMAAQLLGVVMVLLFLRGLFKRRPLPALGGAAAAGDTGSAGNAGAGASGGAQAAPDAAARRMRQEIETAIQADPAAMARLLESWLMEAKQ